LDIIFYLIVGHFLADFSLQTDIIAKFKNPNLNEEAVNSTGVPWYYWMLAHCSIHGMLVGLILGIWWIGLLEIIIHFAIDYSKCKKIINIHHDQFLHLIWKIIWFILALPYFIGVN
jgi:hypothetical protein